ncbi:MAG: flagellar basal body-associated FliL family protein [Bdellovibrionota bacterium]
MADPTPPNSAAAAAPKPGAPPAGEPAAGAAHGAQAAAAAALEKAHELRSRAAKFAGPLKKYFGDKNKDSLIFRLPEAYKGVFSEDPGTRWMSLAFTLSTICLVIVFVTGVHHWFFATRSKLRNLHSVAAEGNKINDFINKEAKQSHAIASMIALGTFTVELKKMPGTEGAYAVMNLAEVDLALQCDDPETRNFIDNHLAETRNQITNLFTAMEREELLSRDGKRRIKRQIMRRLNDWLPKGKVEDLFFTKLVVS